MLVDNIPDIFIPEIENSPEILVHDFRMTTDNVKSKVNLRMHMFSFLQIGKKEVHFAETSVRVDKNQSILTTKGNCLWTELLDTENSYYCKLFFFSEKETSTNLSLSRVDGSHCSTAVLKRTKLCVVSIPVAPSFCSASAAANFSKPELVERATTTISVFGSTPPVRFLFAVVNEQDHILKKGQQPQVVLPPVFVFVLTPTQKPDF